VELINIIMDERLKDSNSSKRFSDDAKDIVSHRGIAKNEERSCSEPPSLASTSKRSRLTTIKEKIIDESSDCELSKSNNHLNESDLELEVDGSTSTTLMQSTPTPSLIACCTARRINSETNLNDASRRFSGFLGNKNKRFCSSTSELNFSSHLDTRKSLFSPKNNALSRQSFNSSLYGSNLSLNSSNSRLFVTNSPFYDGKTMFGGASAYQKRDITQHKFMRMPTLMRPSKSNETKLSNQDLPESNTTKRIMEIMSEFKGPLKEVRTMGSNISSLLNATLAAQNQKRFNEEDLIRQRNLALRNPSNAVNASKLESSQDAFNSYSAASPTIPSMSQLLRMKKLQSNTEKVREIATRSESFLNKNTEYKLPNVNENMESKGPASSGMKMKNNIVRNLIRVDSNKKDDEPPQAINLPNIQLPTLKNIPKFDVQIPAVQKKIEISPPVKNVAPLMPVKSAFESVPKQQPTRVEEIKTTKTVKTLNEDNVVVKFQFAKPLSEKNIQDFENNKTSFIFAKPSTESSPSSYSSKLKFSCITTFIKHNFYFSYNIAIKDFIFCIRIKTKTTENG
jgi:nuclear pore complex protein Nup153